MEDLILRYLDGECTVEEIKQVERLVTENEQFANSFLELEMAHQLLSNAPLHNVPDGFAQKIMQQVNPQILPFHDGIVTKILGALIVFALVLFSLSKSAYLNIRLFTEVSNTINIKTLVIVCSLAFFFIVIDFILNRSQGKLR